MEGGGQPGPLQPQTGPHGARHPGLTESRLGASEWGLGHERGSQPGRLAAEGFLDPHPSPFQAEAMGEGICQSPGHAHLNVTSLGPEFRTFQPLPRAFSLSQHLESCFTVCGVSDPKVDTMVLTVTKPSV